ncbi:MAG: glycine--tRNA ligase [archaeon]
MISIDDMAAFCKQKGLVYPSSEIYGGLAGFFDYGPYGVELKRNIMNEWWKFMVSSRQDIVGMDGSIISPKAVWEASGHLSSGFADIMLPCSKCKNSVRADTFLEEKMGKALGTRDLKKIDELAKKYKCPVCGSPFANSSLLNLMFPITIGSSDTAFLRGETTQMIYLDFKLVQNNSRLKLPFGIAQMGKAFRNEISPRNFLFRMREFEQMEMQFFIRPKENKKWFEYWKKERMKWFESLGVDKKNLRFRKHTKDELAHYAKSAEDIEYKFPFGWKEVEGIHDRGDWDLSNHSKHSKQKLTYFDDEKNEQIIPNIIETSGGLDRAFLVFLYDAYDDDKKRGNKVLHLHPKLVPIKVAVFPLMKKDKLPDKAKPVFDMLKAEFACFYDESGSVGRRYARMDELGTPYCITVDHQSLEDDTVTIRDREDTSQVRVKIKDLKEKLKELL